MKKVLFINVVAICMMAHAKVTAAPLIVAEERALKIESLKERTLITEHFAAIISAVAKNPFDYWHPLLNVASGKQFSDVQKFAALEAAVNDTWQNTGCFTPGILSPHVIIMTLLTRAAGRNPNQGFISTEEALAMLHEGVITQYHNFWADGTHRSLRYAADGITGDASFDPGHPGPNDPHENVEYDDIFTWKGIPLLRWKCLNPIKTVAPPNTYNPPPNNPPPGNGDTYVPPREQREAGINNSNTTLVYLSMPSGQQGQQIQYVPVAAASEKKQSPWGYFLAAAGGYFLGKVIDGNQYYDNYDYSNYPIRYQDDWRFQSSGRRVIVNQPPSRRYNNEILNPHPGTDQGGNRYNGPLNGQQGGTRFVSYGNLR